ncbi:MAG: carboxypeptidase-like regulatory domain-containing protein, partial [Prevotellaceae bacterium]|nr:carboxypeptidase-like regulatory domain-containing protein [Prevotellaceae bacterium]
MKIKLFLVFTLNIFLCDICYSQNTITVSGRVTDFDGNAIDSSIVEISHADFSSAYETYTDKDGYYSINNVKKGKYMAIYAMRPKEYPRANTVPDDEMRLEFWAWNVIADTDLIINPRYHRLELYGTNVFKVEGGYNGVMIYVRPMSLGKLLSYSKDVSLNKSKS